MCATPAVHARPDLKGLVRRRKCTDVLFLLLFLAFLVGWILVGAYAIYYGDVKLLLYPSDSDGRKCGYDSGVEDKPYQMYFDFVKCFSARTVVAGCSTPKVCLKSCPQENINFRNESDCNRTKMICKPNVDPLNESRSCYDLIQSYDCADYVLRSFVLYDRCIPDLSPSSIDKNNIVLDHQFLPMNLSANHLIKSVKKFNVFIELKGFGSEAVNDYKQTWWVIAVGMLACMLLSVIWILLMRLFTGLMIYLTWLSTTVCLAYSCFYTYGRYQALEGVALSDDRGLNPLYLLTHGFGFYLNQRSTWWCLFIASCVCLAILVLLFIAMFKRMRFAIKILDMASKVVLSNMLIILCPVLPWLMHMLTVCLFVVLALHISAIGVREHQVTRMPANCTSCHSYRLNDTCVPELFHHTCQVQCPLAECTFVLYRRFAEFATVLHVYNLFAVLWVTLFWSAFTEMTLSSIFAGWYWTFDKSRRGALGVGKAYSRVLRYHTGTLAFGSFLIAVLRVVRAILLYVQRKCRQHTNNTLMRGLLTACSCCMWCLDRFIRYVSRNAYIMTAVHGTNFCKSAHRAFSLVASNMLRALAVDSVCDFMLFLGRLTVSISVSVGAFYFLDNRFHIGGITTPTVQHPWVSAATLALACYFISGLFFNLFSSAVDTLFLCCLEDLERNDGSKERPYFMPKSVMSMIGKQNSPA